MQFFVGSVQGYTQVASGRRANRNPRRAPKPQVISRLGHASRPRALHRSRDLVSDLLRDAGSGQPFWKFWGRSVQKDYPPKLRSNPVSLALSQLGGTDTHSTPVIERTVEELHDCLGNQVATPRAGRTDAGPLLAALRAGRTDNALRTELASYFQSATHERSHETMEDIRAASLLDQFLAAALRDDQGRPVDPAIRDGIHAIMQTGRLDVYAETLATIGVAYSAVGDYGGNNVYDDSKKGVFLNPNTRNPEVLKRVLAHEIFHAFNAAHGLDRSRPGLEGPGALNSLNEGFGIAVIPFAFEPNASLNLAEMVYGTKNYYRDIGIAGYDRNFPLGNATNADSKLRGLLRAVSAQDRSQLLWEDSHKLTEDYQSFFEGLNRADGSWAEQVEIATAGMLSARSPVAAKESPRATEPLDRIAPPEA